MIKNKGFSLFEMVLFMGIMAILFPLLIGQFNEFSNKLKNQQYVDQTRSYAKAFAKQINDSYATYYDQAKLNPTDPIVIKYSQLKKYGYAPAGMVDQNVFGQVPCVSMIYNQKSDQLQAIMFYTSTSDNANQLTINGGRSATNMFGGEAGYIDDAGDINGSGRGWKISANSPLLSVLPNCDLTTIPNNSMVINLSMLPELSNTLPEDVSIHKITDNISGKNPGESGNYNTMLTDLTLSVSGGKTSGIFLADNNIESGVFLGAGSADVLKDARQDNRHTTQQFPDGDTDVVFANGDLVTKTFKPTQKKFAFDECSSDEIGKEVIDGAYNNVMAEQLTCVHNVIYCSDSSDFACYLPSKSLTIQYTPNSGSFDCQAVAGPGFYIVPHSIIEASNSSNLPSEHSWCSWNSDPIQDHYSYYTNGMPYALYTTQHWHSDGCGWGVCCSWVQERTPTITSIQCTNDTTTFAVK